MKESIAAIVTLAFMVASVAVGSWTERTSEKPIAATLVQVCGQPLAIIVTKRNGESTIYQPGDPGVLEAVKPVPKKDMHTFAAEGAFCEKPKVY